jgi:PAS domain S-box-containing protein
MKVAFCGAVEDFRAAAKRVGLGRLELASPRNGIEWSEALESCDLVVVDESGATAFTESFDQHASPTRPKFALVVGTGSPAVTVASKLSSADGMVVVAVAQVSEAAVACKMVELLRREGSDWPVKSETQYTDWLLKIANELSIVSVTDRDGTIIYANDRFEALSGYTKEELIGSTHRKVKSGEHDDAFYSELWETISSGRMWQGDICNRKKSGELYWVAATIVAEMGADGFPVRYFSARTDITQAKRSERELRTAKEVADRANFAKSEFLSGMSHELRTPLNAVLGFGQLLREERAIKGSDRLALWVEQICKAGDHLLSLINQVLDMSQAEAGKVLMSIEPVDIEKVVSESVSLVRGMAQKNSISIHVQAKAVEEAVVAAADFTRLKQVVLNLLSNGVKYNRAFGSVFVEYGYHQDSVLITVRDTGLGISEEARHKLFTPFERLGHTSGAIEGTGIGLALSRKLIEGMKGEIGYRPWVGADGSGGSEFFISIGRGNQVSSKEIQEEELTVLDTLASEPKLILYIEDNPSNQLLMKAMLKRFELDLECAWNAEIGLSMASVRCPDLVIMDINLPGMSGFDALQKIRSRPEFAHVPVLGLTADVMRPAVRQEAAAKFDQFMSKPVKMKELRRVLESMLNTRLVVKE